MQAFLVQIATVRGETIDDETTKQTRTYLTCIHGIYRKCETNGASG